MSIKARGLGALAAAGFILAAGCVSSTAPNQMKIGLWASRHGLWNEAIFRWQLVLTAEPDSAAAHNNLAVAYEVKGQWDDARREYEAALKISPRNSRIISNYDQFKKNMEKPGDKKPEPETRPPDEKRP